MLTDAELSDVAKAVIGVRGVVGVVLGGSRARGDHRPESDVDLGLYYRPPLDVPALRAVAGEVAAADGEVTEPGAWGPWVDGGAWLHVNGVAVDWLYRNVDRVRAAWHDAAEGRFAFHAQVGHPLGVPDFAYAGELALGIVLADPSGELTALRRQVSVYPPPLADAVMRRGLWEAGFCLDIAHKAVPRADTAYVAGCLFRAMELCAHVLHAYNGHWLINEKGAVAAAGRLAQAPAAFSARVHGLLARLGDQPDELAHALAVAAGMLEEVRAACGGAPRPQS